MQQDQISRAVKAELDSKIVNIELTLISIIQSIPLGILAEQVVEPLKQTEWQVLIYLGIGLLTILLFWSRALIHTLSFIGWPLDFTHNFLYIFSTLVQSVLMSQISSPQTWYGWWIAYTAVLWIMYAVDLRMIRLQIKSEREVNGLLLLNDVLADQKRNVNIYIPLAAGFSVVAWWLVTTYPDIFIEHHWHIALAAVQMISGGVYLWEGYAILRRRNERILRRNVDAID